MSAIKRILVPTDFSPPSQIALEYAVDLAQRVGAAIHLMHVLEDQAFGAAYPDGFFAELPGVRAQMLEHAHRQLGDCIARCKDANVEVTSQVVFGRPASAMCEQAQRRGTDLIVMGTHGRSGFAHLLLGSVAERVIRMAPCPVLTLRDTARVADMVPADSLKALA